MATATLNWYFSYNGSNGDRCGLDVDYFQFNGSSATFPTTATTINSITIYFSNCLSGNFPGSSSFAPSYNAYFTVLSGGSYINLGSSSIQVYGYNYRTSSYANLSYIDNIDTILSNGISGLRMTDDVGYFRGYNPSGSMYMEINYEYIENPTITTQPTISSINPTSGASTTITWSTATVNNQGNSTIYYQYFVGPNSTYSDSYHIGTTTGTSATITEAQIISKCGNGFGASSNGSVCYLFVRAYWDNGSTQGGWVIPTGATFTYYPTINAPTNVSITSSSGTSTTVKWTNQLAGNNSQPQAILVIDNTNTYYATNITSSNNGYVISENIWKSLGKGKHNIYIAHEWYGRWMYSSYITFTYIPTFPNPSITLNNVSGNSITIKNKIATASDGQNCVTRFWINSSYIGEYSGDITVNEDTLSVISKNSGYNRVFNLIFKSFYNGSYSSGVTKNFTYIPTLYNPDYFTVNETSSSSGRTAIFKWGKASLYDGGTDITYKLYVNDNLYYEGNSPLEVSEGTFISWNNYEQQTWKLQANGGGRYGSILYVTFTYIPLLIGASNLKIYNTSSYIGNDISLSWDIGSLSNGESISQSLLIDDTIYSSYNNISGNTLMISKDIAKQWKGKTITIKIRTTGRNQIIDSNSVLYTYKPKAKTIWYMNKEYYIYINNNGVAQLCDWFIK